MAKNRNVSSRRSYPTLRAMLRGGRGGHRAMRAPWFSGYPTRARPAWTQCWKKKA